MFRIDPKEAILDHAARLAPAGLANAAADILSRPVERNMSGTVITGVTQAIEAALLVTLGLAIYGIYVHNGQIGFYLGATLSSVLVANVLLNAARTHRIAMYRLGPQHICRVLAAWSTVMILLSLLAFMFKASDMVSRVWLVSWYASGALVLVLFRLSVRAVVRQ